MMARQCDGCDCLIDSDEYIELQARTLKTTESENQDPIAQGYADFCDGCVANGTALRKVLEMIDRKLDPITVTIP